MSRIDKLFTHALRASGGPGILLERHRTILVRGSIDDQLANEVLAKMLYLHQQARKPLSIYVDSPGGQVTSSLAIRDMIDDMRDLVSTHCLGRAAGMALLVLAHGAPGSRTAAPAARFELTPIIALDHDALAPTEVARIERIVTDMLAQDTHRPADDIGRDMAGWLALDADAARDYGLVDRVED